MLTSSKLLLLWQVAGVDLISSADDDRMSSYLLLL